jgi:CheY-like chemotaxis protein
MEKSMSILLVEVDLELQRITCEILENLGYSVEAASTAEQAIAFIKTRKFEILVSDINLPGMSGIDLTNILIQAIPDIRIIFISGYGYLVADKTNFPFYLLPKPFNAKQLAEAVECVLSV